jgi:hypothetical protein
MQPYDLPTPLLRVIHPCYQHCGVHNKLKNVKIFEAKERIQNGAMTKIWRSGAKIELKILYFDGTRQDKLASLKFQKPRTYRL